ncbi:hypothetical protein ACROYT_G008574 [Oculina patagonica]
MDIKTLLNNLHEEVSCSVCMTTFTEPKQLPCLHSFCLHCLEGILRTSGRRDIINCPECRRESRVPASGNLNDLPTNFRINSLLDVLAIKECSTTGVKCGNCDKKSAQSLYCFQCFSFWCDFCITGHNIIRTNAGHRVLALKDFEDQDIEDVLKRPAFCQQKHHEQEELKFFCKDCEVAVCNSCVATIHEGHAKIHLEEAANERKLQINSTIELQKEKVQQKRNKITELDENCIHIEAQAAAVKRDVHRVAESLTAAIEAKKKEILKEVDNQVKESVERLRTQQCEMDNQVKLIEKGIEKTETILKRSTSAEIVRLDSKSSLNVIFQEEVSDEEQQVDRDFEGLRRFIFAENETLLDKINAEGIGSFKTFVSKTCAQQSSAEGKGISEATAGLETHFILTTRNAQGEQCYEERDSVTVQITNQQGRETQTVQTCAFFRGSAVGMLNGLCNWGVAVSEQNEITVTETDNHRVSVFSSDGTHLRSFGRKGNKQGEFNYPAGIAFDNNGNIIVVDSDNHRVQVFSEQGEYLNQFGEQGSLDHQLEDPFGVSVDSDGNIIVADSGNKLIKIFSPSGQFLRKFGREGSFNKPIHCVEYEKYLIVSDRDDHCIKVFDTNGHFLYKFGKEGERDGEFNKPRCLSVNKAGHLMVCDSWNHRVQVFELSGKFVTKFGSKGSGIGEFNNPRFTAVLSDGRIVVTNVWNNRIQIFE